jgi:hypothetical protein
MEYFENMRNIMYSIKDFKNDIQEILNICKEDLLAISRGEKRQATKEQIEKTIIPEMNDLLIKIETKKIPPKGERWLNSVAYITRGWNWDIWSEDRLNIKLPELDNIQVSDLRPLRFP